MKFSIIHSSARPDKWKEIYNAWLNAADHPWEVEYVLVCDRRWGFKELPKTTKPNFRAVWNTGRRCYVDGVNIGAAYATGDVLIVNADDQYPCDPWDTLLEQTIDRASTNPAADFVIEVSTGTPAEHDRGIVVMPILSRARYEKYGYVFYPAYESMYADNDFFELAQRDCAIINARNLLFPHRNALFNPSVPWDPAYEAQNRQEAYDLGLAVLQKRRESNFGDVTVKTITQERGNKGRFVCVFPGEQFSQVWVGHCIELVTTLSLEYQLQVQTGFSSNVYLTRQALFDALAKLVPVPDFVLWVDDDQLLTPEQLKMLISDLEQDPELDGVCAWAWCQSNYYGSGPMMSCGGWDAAGKVTRFTLDTLMAGDEVLKPVSFSGLPAILMRGRVMEKIGPGAFLPLYDAEQFPPWGWAGEDAAFFFRARDKGLKFVVDRRVQVPHLKLGCQEPMAGVPSPAHASES